MILSGVLQGIILWIQSLLINCYEYVSDTLLDVFQLNLAYFRENLPLTDAIMEVLWAAGWALLLGNLVFQAMKGMLSGLGFESEDPKILFGRTAVFAFLLAVCPQICEIAMDLTGKVIALLRIPDAASIRFLQESDFHFPAAWLLAVIVDVILIYQVLRVFLSIAERYVLLVLLTVCAPLAFGLGGSKQTEDLFKGWVRLLGSVCGMTVLNLVTLKFLLAGMSDPPGDVMVIPWMLLMMGIGKAGKKSDELLSRIGLNTPRTGESIGRGMPGMMAAAAFRALIRTAPAGHGTAGARPAAGQTRTQSRGWSRETREHSGAFSEERQTASQESTFTTEGVASPETEVPPSRPPVGRRERTPAFTSGTKPDSRPPLQPTEVRTSFYYGDGTFAGEGIIKTAVPPSPPSAARSVEPAPARPPLNRRGWEVPSGAAQNAGENTQSRPRPAPASPVSAERTSSDNQTKPQYRYGERPPVSSRFESKAPQASATTAANGHSAVFTGRCVSERSETVSRQLGDRPAPVVPGASKNVPVVTNGAGKTPVPTVRGTVQAAGRNTATNTVPLSAPPFPTQRPEHADTMSKGQAVRAKPQQQQNMPRPEMRRDAVSKPEAHKDTIPKSRPSNPPLNRRGRT